MKRELKNHFIILLIVPNIGFVAMLLIHMIPVDKMQEHVLWSLDMIVREFEQEALIDGYPATLTGSFTDCLMLEHAVYENEEHSTLEQTLHMYRGESYYAPDCSDVWHPGESLVDYLHGVEQPREVEYSRYWHGYLVVLKPLLFLTSFNSIRLINACFQLFMVGWCLILFTKKNEDGLTYAFLGALPFLFFVSAFSSLSQSICLYLMLLAVLVLLTFDNTLYHKKLYGIYFLIVGMFTSYFDFFTYPLITLGFPLCIYLFLHCENCRKNCFRLFCLSGEWTVGYAWMWMSKWLLTDLLTGSHTIKDALQTILVRTDSAEGYGKGTGFIKVLLLNMQPYMNWAYFLLLIMLIIIALIKVVRMKKCVLQLKKAIPFFILAMYPLAWWFLVQNHSEQHWMFTCKIISISVFALFAGVQISVKERHISKS